MAKKKQEDELAALRAENARLKAMLDQQEAAQQERLPQPVAEEELAETPAPDAPKRPRKLRKKGMSISEIRAWVGALFVFGAVLTILGTLVLLALGTNLGISSQWEGWRWVSISLFFLPTIIFISFKIRAKRKEAMRAQQKEQERLERERQRELARLARAQQKEDARVARLQERERAKAAAPKTSRERPRMTRPLRAPTTQKLEPEDAP